MGDFPAAEGLLLERGTPPWPDWLEEARLDDSIVDMAYEATPPELRALVKTGLAMAFAHFGPREDQTDSVVRKPPAGFWISRQLRPAPWCVVAIDAAYAAAARVTAACVLPRLCDVPEVFAVLVGEDDEDVQPTDNTLTALTLSGIDDVFCLSRERACALLGELAAQVADAEHGGPQGRLLLLHDGALQSLGEQAAALRIPYYEEKSAPQLTVLPGTACSAEALTFAHGEIVTSAALEPATQAVLAALPTGGAMPPEGAVAEAMRRGLPVFGPGCEGFWLHPGLEPEFFMVRGMAAGML